jgi:hypothetical protein
MGPEQVVAGAVRLRLVADARRVHAVHVAGDGDDPGLIDRDPVLDPVGEALVHEAGVVGEDRRQVVAEPAAQLVLKGLRQVPVMQRHHGADSRVEQAVDQPVVVVQAGGVCLAAAGGLDARPGNAEPISV